MIMPPTANPTPGNRRFPSGPAEPYRAGDDLLDWLGRHFADFGDTYKASIYGGDAYVTRSPVDAHHVLVGNASNYVKGRLIKRIALLLGNGLMTSEGKFWRRQRRMIQPAFHRNVLVALTPAMASASLQLCERWQTAADEGATINLRRDIGDAVLTSVLQAVFGDDCKRVAPHFAVLSKDAARSMAFAQMFRALGDMVLQIVQERRAAVSSGKDMLGVMIAARDRGSGAAMSERQILNEVMTLVVAGHETTAATLCWTWHALAQHPDVELRLWQEVDALLGAAIPAVEDLVKFQYARQVLDEVLRLYPPGWLVTRRALNDDRLSEYFVPAGTEIYLPIFFIQRHPQLWPDPERFHPDRFAGGDGGRRPLALLPFSAGPRNCIGEHFARQQMLIHLLVIARHLRLRLIAPQTIAFDTGVNLRSRDDFLMAPERRVTQ